MIPSDPSSPAPPTWKSGTPAGVTDVGRSDDLVLVQVTLSAGRSTEQNQAFYALLAALLQEEPGLRPENVTIVLVENIRENRSFGNGEASYVVLPRERWR